MVDMTGKEPVVAEEIVNLTEIAEGWEVVDVSVDHSGTAIALFEQQTPAFLSISGSTHAEEEKADRDRFRYRIIKLTPGSVRFEMSFESPNWCQQISGWREDDFVLATYIDELEDFYVRTIPDAGLRQDAMRVGVGRIDGTASGRIWAMYSDEEYFWAPGVMCWNAIGQPLLDWQKWRRHRLVPGVFDCYASNIVSDEEAWFWYYTDTSDLRFALVRLRGLELNRWWQDLPVAYSHAFAVSSVYVLFHGGYHDSDETARRGPRYADDHFHLVDLERMDFREFYPISADGRPLMPELSFGRGPKLYFQDSGVLYAVDASKLSM